MKITWPPRKKQVRQRRSPRRTASPWLRTVVKEPSTKRLVENMVQSNAVLQAAIVAEMTGITIDPRDIKIASPEEAFEHFIINEALKDLAKDRDFIAMAKEVVMDMIYESASRHFGLGKGQHGGRGNNSGDGRPGSPHVEGSGQVDLLSMIDMVERLKAKVGNGSTLETLLKSPVLIELVKTVIPTLLSRVRNQQQGQTTLPSDLIEVEVDGELVEMTMRGYETWKSLKDRMAGGVDSLAGSPAGDSPEPGPAVVAPTPAASEAAATTPQLAGSPDSTGSSGPAAQAEAKPFSDSDSASS
jgi:hypothetical protein